MPKQALSFPPGEAWFATSTDGQATVMNKVGGRVYQSVNHPQCRVCQNPYKVEIENALLKSFSYKTIIDSLPEEAKVSVGSIGTHLRDGHMPVQESMKRVIIEADAKERGLDVEAYEQALGNYVTFARLGLQRALERLTAGEIEPDMTDGLALAKFLAQLESQAESTDMGMIIQGFLVYMKAVRDICAPEQTQQIISRIAKDPVMASLLRQQQQTVAGELGE